MTVNAVSISPLCNPDSLRIAFVSGRAGHWGQSRLLVLFLRRSQRNIKRDLSYPTRIVRRVLSGSVPGEKATSTANPIAHPEPRRLNVKPRVVVALDVDSELQAMKIVEALKAEVSIFKVGLELFSSVGPQIVKKIRDAGCEVFLDCKLLDIPATVAGASRASAQMGVLFFNVHCFGGSEMIIAAVQASKLCSRSFDRSPLVLGVTVFTSLDETAIRRELNVDMSVVEEVRALARLGVENGLDGIIASPQEASSLREILPAKVLIVTPGVRPSWASQNDQKRTATPSEAIRAGADLVVVGRPITQPPPAIGSPLQAAKLVIDEIAKVI